MPQTDFKLSFSRNFSQQHRQFNVVIQPQCGDESVPAWERWNGTVSLNLYAATVAHFSTTRDPDAHDVERDGYRYGTRITVGGERASMLGTSAMQMMLDTCQHAMYIGEQALAMIQEGRSMADIFEWLGGYDQEHQASLRKERRNQQVLALDLGNGNYLALSEIWESLDDLERYYAPIYPTISFRVAPSQCDTLESLLTSGHYLVKQGSRIAPDD